MKRIAYAVMINDRIEMWPQGGDDRDMLGEDCEQMEIYATREWAERVKNLYVERTGSRYKVVPIRISKSDQ